jgi:hypothetical protein
VCGLEATLSQDNAIGQVELLEKIEACKIRIEDIEAAIGARRASGRETKEIDAQLRLESDFLHLLEDMVAATPVSIAKE